MIKSFVYYPLVAKCIPEELAMNYPVDRHRGLLIAYINLATQYETLLNVRITLGVNTHLFNEVVNHIKYNSARREREIPTEVRYRLNSLNNEIEPIISMYTTLSLYLERAKSNIKFLGDLPKDVRLFMLNYLVDYRCASSYYTLPDLPEEISEICSHNAPEKLKDASYERVISEYDSFMDYWYLYKGLAVL